MLAKGFALLGIMAGLCAGNAQAASIGDLLITEIMANPAALPDSRGEWFELYNPTDSIIDLDDVTIGDDGGDRHRIESDLLILPGHFLTLARSDDPGFIPDYVYDDFTLSNSGDEILLFENDIEVLRLDYGAAFDEAGRSRDLAALPMLASNYALTLASLTYGFGDIGTPGQGGALHTVSTVPLPATAWLFLSAITLIATRTRPGIVIPRKPGLVIPRLDRGIHLQAPKQPRSATISHPHLEAPAS